MTLIGITDEDKHLHSGHREVIPSLLARYLPSVDKRNNRDMHITQLSTHKSENGTHTLWSTYTQVLIHVYAEA